MLEFGHFLFSKVESSGHGTGKISTDILENLEFVTPPNHVLVSLMPILEHLNDRIAANDMENGTLAATRDLLLPKLISGEIRVKDAEKLAEDGA